MAIEDFLNGKRQSPPVLDHNHCRFGISLRSEVLVDGVVLPGLGGLPGFRSIDELHQRIHAMAAEVLLLHGERRQTEAMNRIAKLHALLDEIFEKLNSLLQP